MTEFDSEKVCKAMFNFQTNIAGTLASDNPPRQFLNPEPIEEKLCEPVTIEEIEESLKKLKTGKAPSPITGITTEMLKFGGRHLATLMKKTIDLCITDSEICLVWRKGEVIFLYKKGDTTQCGNYRPITKLDVLGKVVIDILQSRIMKHCEDNRLLSEYQCGFRKKRGTHHQGCYHYWTLLLLRKKLRKQMRWGEDHSSCTKISQKIDLRQHKKGVRWNKRQQTGLFGLYVDFSKAFDRVDRKYLRQRLKELGTPDKLLDLFDHMNKNTWNRIKIGNILSKETFRTLAGAAQGCTASPTFFCCFIDALLKKVEQCENVAQINILAKSIMAFADDIATIACGADNMQKLVDEFAKLIKWIGMLANVKKCAIVCFEGEDDVKFSWGDTGKFLEILEWYPYLGLKIQNNLKWDRMVEQYRSTGKYRTYECKKILRNWYIKIKDKMMIINAMIRSSMMYGCETVELKRNEAHKLDIVLAIAIRWTLNCDRYCNKSWMFELLGWFKFGTMFELRKHKYHKALHKLDDIRAVKIAFLQMINEGLLTDRSVSTRNDIMNSEYVANRREWRTHDRKLGLTIGSYNKPPGKIDELIFMKYRKWINFLGGGWRPKQHICPLCGQLCSDSFVIPSTPLHVIHLLKCPFLSIPDNIINVSKIVNYNEDIEVRKAHATNLHMLITQYSCMMKKAKEYYKHVILNKHIMVSFVNHETGWIRTGEISNIWSGSHCRISSLTEHNELDVDVMEEITNGTLIVLDDEVNSWWSKHWQKMNPKLEHYKAPLTFDSKITFSSNKLQITFSFLCSDNTSSPKNDFVASLFSLSKQCACESSVVQGLCPIHAYCSTCCCFAHNTLTSACSLRAT